MTPEEFKERMLKIAAGDEVDGYYDQEEGHVDADNLLCEALESLGFHEGVVVYQKLEKWFA